MTTLSTHTKIMKVFICSGAPQHVHPGTAILKAANGYVCPICGKPVADCTNTRLGQEYFAFARPDLARKAQQ